MNITKERSRKNKPKKILGLDRVLELNVFVFGVVVFFSIMSILANLKKKRWKIY
jgi:hypothetical protein